ncbi:uncharacterized protein LOC141627869 [Silene latifolia]|uniref:uncharacterized protein LOC141627869 n=1 Tax=Silene latifolia TaxID=37657 RepID=UPI003D777F69
MHPPKLVLEVFYLVILQGLVLVQMVMLYSLLGVMHNIGFWNVRGLNNPSKQKQVKWFIHTHMVGLFGLLETKVKPLSLNTVRLNVCDGWSLSTNSTYHPGGRVWVLWNPSLFYVHFVHYIPQAIHMKVTEISSQFHFFCTMIYAFNDTTDRKSLWHDLCSFSDHIHDPWILCRDFNCVLRPSERLGGQSSDEEMVDFRKCLDYCQLMDSPAASSYYTWNNKQKPQTRVYSRLDMVLVNIHWLQHRCNSYVHFYNEVKEREAAGVYRELQAACASFLIQKTTATWFYEGLLGTDGNITKVSTSVVQQGPVCNTDHHTILLAPVTKKEIKDAIFSIPNHKAPGPDGFSSAFFKDSWSVIGDEVCDAILDFFQSGKLLQQLLCTRLSAILPDIVSKTQGGFVKGRSIAENILICQDIVRLYNRKTVSPRCLMKIDLKKAYDSVHWDFVEQMLIALKFPTKFTDLVMGDTTSIMILLRAFAIFSVATGLQMNSMKSNIYFNGVASSVKLDILQVSGFSEGSLPFKYLGVPISTGRISVKNCSCLIEKVTEKITGYAAKKLSYAGRLTLVNAVLTTLYTYWASIFILPKGVLRKIDALCRNYVWDGTSEYVRSPLVSWDKMCVPKDESGLGIRHSIAWNLASICKLSWWIYSNQDSLWVQWVHHIYMKGVPWSAYTPKNDSPWSWKTICKVRDKFNASFSPSGLWLACPSGWLIAREALQLKDKLLMLGNTVEDTCFLCGTDTETHSHLFNQCCYTRQLIKLLSLKLQLWLPATNLLAWIQAKPWAKIKKRVTIVWIKALCYAIWNQRNKARLEGAVTRPEIVFQQIGCLLKCRFLAWQVSPIYKS